MNGTGARKGARFALPEVAMGTASRGGRLCSSRYPQERAMTHQDELRHRAIERLHRRHARHGLADAAKPVSWGDQLFILLLGGSLVVTLLANVLMRAIGG